MTKAQDSKLKKIGIFTLTQAEELGLSQQTLSKLVKQEKLKRITRGVFAHPKASLDREFNFQIACAKLGPDAVIESTLEVVKEKAESDLNDGVWFRFSGWLYKATPDSSVQDAPIVAQPNPIR